MEDFRPKALTTDDIGAIFKEAGTQAEAHEAAAWVNYVRAKAAREAGESEVLRLKEAARIRDTPDA